MPIPWELVGIGAVAILSGVGELVRRGRLKLPARAGMHNGDRDTLNEIYETVTHVDDKVENIEEKTDRNAYLIQQFHGEESVDVPVRDVLDDDDFFRGGTRGDD